MIINLVNHCHSLLKYMTLCAIRKWSLILGDPLDVLVTVSFDIMKCLFLSLNPINVQFSTVRVHMFYVLEYNFFPSGKLHHF